MAPGELLEPAAVVVEVLEFPTGDDLAGDLGAVDDVLDESEDRLALHGLLDELVDGVEAPRGAVDEGDDDIARLEFLGFLDGEFRRPVVDLRVEERDIVGGEKRDDLLFAPEIATAHTCKEDFAVVHGRSLSHKRVPYPY